MRNEIEVIVAKRDQAVLLRKYPPARRGFFLYPTYEFARPNDCLERSQLQYREFVKTVVSSKPKKMTNITHYASIDSVFHIKKADLHKLGPTAGLYV
jgi:hypothetical protein